MNRRRELVLQRVSRIGSLTDANYLGQNTKFKGKPTGALTIEAAIGTYMMKNDDIYDMRHLQDTYIQTSTDTKNQKWDRLSKQMEEYMSAAEERQLADARAGRTYNAEDNQLDSEELEKILAEDASARYQLKQYNTQAGGGSESAYDKLDANRCSGFLLYSYNKQGVHSVLGEHITPGSYGGRITVGDFASKA